MAQAKEIGRRIKSITNTGQIMKAMELVSVIKMQKAVNQDIASRPYCESANEILANLYNGIDAEKHPFLQKRAGNKTLIILVTADKGLCGGLNMRAIKMALEIAKESEEPAFITVGIKGRNFLNTYGYKIVAEFSDISKDPTIPNLRPIAKVASDDFLSGNFDKVVMVYPHFISTLNQTILSIHVLPLSEIKSDEKADEEIIYEPGKDAILEELIPRILEIKIRQAILESIASEHSARMMAMKNANENANDIIDDLTLALNQTRQAGITRELAEISAGKMTLEE